MTVEEYAALVGHQVGCSPWFTVSQSLIDRFADLTFDHSYIHVDEVRAADSPFGTTIAHGFLLLSLIPHLREASGAVFPDFRTGLNCGADRLRFIRPVPSGSRIRGRFHLGDITRKSPDVYREVIEVEVEVEGQDGPALVARWISQYCV
jgi:acyl dehydratase